MERFWFVISITGLKTSNAGMDDDNNNDDNDNLINQHQK
jgi:hypothetical protein